MSEGFEKAKRSFEKAKLGFEKAGVEKLLAQSNPNLDLTVTVDTDWSIKIHLKIPPTLLAQVLQTRLDEINQSLAGE